ncbi:unnamed protein product [Trichobilharzia regenti]|nr:unnamed protein product [Trichobilharzia regenti]
MGSGFGPPWSAEHHHSLRNIFLLQKEKLCLHDKTKEEDGSRGRSGGGGGGAGRSGGRIYWLVMTVKSYQIKLERLQDRKI